MYLQPSLSEFYRAMNLVSQPTQRGEPQEGTVWLPVRAFDPQSLVASDGASVFSRLLEHCDCVIVEDADLRPNDLVEHLADCPRTPAAPDMTKAMQLTGNYGYVLWPRESAAPNVEGERLW